MSIFTTKEQNLLINIEANETLNKSIQTDGNDYSRAGQKLSPRDMLDIQLGIYKSEGLENTHGESFHKDNDKDAEKHQKTVEDVSDQKKRKESVDESRKPGKSEKNKRFIIEKENDDSISLISRSMSDELFLKAMGWSEVITKSDDTEVEGDEVEMPKKEFVKEHKKLVSTLESPSKKDDKKEAKEQKKELKEVTESKKSFPDADVDYKDESEDDKEDREELKAKKKKEEPVKDFPISKKSGLDSLVDLIKGCEKPSNPVNEIDLVKKEEPKKKIAKKGFVRASGPGGVTFDFGPTTGNPIADNFQKHLNDFSEPQQESIIRGQTESFNNAMDEFCTKGEKNYNNKHHDMTSDGTVHPDMNDKLSGSFDEQTSKAIKEGSVQVQEGFVPQANAGGELNTGDTGPAVINEYNKTEITMGGEVIKATSETDQALIEVMRKSHQDDGTGTMVSTGGQNVMIDAATGTIVE